MQNTKQKYANLTNALKNNRINIKKSCINKITKNLQNLTKKKTKVFQLIV